MARVLVTVGMSSFPFDRLVRAIAPVVHAPRRVRADRRVDDQATVPVGTAAAVRRDAGAPRRCRCRRDPRREHRPARAVARSGARRGRPDRRARRDAERSPGHVPPCGADAWPSARGLGRRPDPGGRRRCTRLWPPRSSPRARPHREPTQKHLPTGSTPRARAPPSHSEHTWLKTRRRRSPEFYDRLASSFDDFFAVPHRRAYDDLAWEHITALPVTGPGVVLDLGLRHRAMGGALRERGMALYRRRRRAPHGRGRARPAPRRGDHRGVHGRRRPRARLRRSRHRDGVAAVLPRSGRARPPDGRLGQARVVCLRARRLVPRTLLELVGNGQRGRSTRAGERRGGRAGSLEGAAVEYALLDAAALADLFRAAGCADVRTSGLLVGLTARGRDRWNEQYAADPDATLDAERFLPRSRSPPTRESTCCSPRGSRPPSVMNRSTAAATRCARATP